MSFNNPHTNLELMKQLALQKSKEHGMNYNVVILNPGKNGEFLQDESSYEMVTDSFFEKQRPHVKKLVSTDELVSI